MNDNKIKSTNLSKGKPYALFVVICGGGVMLAPELLLMLLALLFGITRLPKPIAFASATAIGILGVALSLLARGLWEKWATQKGLLQNQKVFQYSQTVGLISKRRRHENSKG